MSGNCQEDCQEHILFLNDVCQQAMAKRRTRGFWSGLATEVQQHGKNRPTAQMEPKSIRIYVDAEVMSRGWQLPYDVMAIVE